MMSQHTMISYIPFPLGTEITAVFKGKDMAKPISESHFEGLFPRITSRSKYHQSESISKTESY